jgi:glucoamylase
MMFAASVAIAALTALACASPQKRASALDTYVARERVIAFNHALGNIGGTNHTRVPAANPGMVTASPSNHFPNYFYSWTRDSALTYAMIVDELIFGNLTLEKTVQDYTLAQADVQTVDNPSGTLWPAGLGLGEMKFFLNKTRFNEDWGRPQRDGPALRATVFIKLCQALIAAGNKTVAEEVYWPLILNDLKYVGQYWNDTGYELWEEVHGTSFYTLNAQHRALTSGGYLAEMLDVPCNPCKQAPEIACLLQHFWNGTGNYITADVNRNQITTRSGINVSPLIFSIQVFDIQANCETSGKTISHSPATCSNRRKYLLMGSRLSTLQLQNPRHTQSRR